MSQRYKGAVISATPPTTSTTSAPGAWTLQQQMQAQGAGTWPFGGPFNYIEDVFSTYLYTGNSTSGGTQTITNNIDLSTKGGLVWIKGRSAASNHILTDTTRGAGASATNNNALASNLTTAEDLGGSSYDYLSSFSTTGFVVTQGGTTTATRGTNYNNVTYASWTFRKQAKFFDIQTWSGDGTAQRAISHNLGSVPGCIFVKCTDASTSSDWVVWHRSLSTTTSDLVLNTTAAEADYGLFGTTAPTSTNFYLGVSTNGLVDYYNKSGRSYVAYIFAHNAGGFGLTGTDNVISCGSYTGTGTAGLNVSLGYEPQWVLIKNASVGGDDWLLEDVMRSMSNTGSRYLSPNGAYAEGNAGQATVVPTATGFTIAADSAWTGFNTNGNTYIYIAIRRGPMKTPTSGTSVFSPVSQTGDASITSIGFSPDSAWIKNLAGSAGLVIDRLRGVDKSLAPAVTDQEYTSAGVIDAFLMNGLDLGSSIGPSDSNIFWSFLRAPSFMDVVCYTGTGSNTTQTHNLGVVPELMIVKRRNTAANWQVYSAALANTEYLVLNSTLAKATGTTRWNSTTPTSSVFTVGTDTTVNASGGTYVAYLFATCAGVSKVGSYTGTGTTKQIDCGFTGGARFVLIKRTDSTGDWYVWDSARGIVSGNDPYLLLNSSAAEVTNTDYIDTYSAGFEISSTAPAAINANGGSYIYLAIA